MPAKPVSKLEDYTDDNALTGDSQKLRHVAIIMDGNGRWAKARGLGGAAGVWEGVEGVGRALEAGRDMVF